jgi:hypothetical protein
MECRLQNIEGVGDACLELFSAAGFECVGHLRDLQDEETVRTKLEAAAQTLGATDTSQRRVARCMQIALKIRHPEAAPFAPAHLTCPTVSNRHGE